MKIQIIRKKRKTLTIRISDKGEVIVSCPLTYSDKDVKKIIEQKQNWINNALIKVNEKFKRNELFYSYSKILFFGKEYNVVFRENSLWIGDRRISNSRSNSNIINILKKWLHEQAKTYLNAFLTQLSTQTGINYKNFSLISARKKWGSCDNHGEIRLNYKLIMLKPEYIQYVCIHELCHIKHLNHSKNFWTTVEKFCSNYKKIREQMKEFSFCLELF